MCPRKGRAVRLPLLPALSLRDIADPTLRGLRQPESSAKSRKLTAESCFLREQSENVYENKGTVQKSTTPDPSLCEEGNCGLPSSDEEGVGVVLRYNNWRNKARMSMKTKDNDNVS